MDCCGCGSSHERTAADRHMLRTSRTIGVSFESHTTTPRNLVRLVVGRSVLTRLGFGETRERNRMAIGTSQSDISYGSLPSVI